MSLANSEQKDITYQILDINPEPIGVFTLPKEKHLKYKKDIQTILENPSQELISEHSHTPYTKHICNKADQSIFKSFPQLLDLKTDIKYMLLGYIQKIGFMCDSIVINSAWLNISQKGSVLSPHYHGNSYLSGNYFVNFEQSKHSLLSFQNDRGKAITHYSQTFSLPETPGFRTVYNGDYLSIPAEEGQILIWRSHMRHGYINTNEGDNRTTLSFNSIPQTLRSGAYSFTVNDN